MSDREMSRPQSRDGDVDGLGPGSRIGKYDIVETIGRGGMGAVFRCRHRALGTEVAVKVVAFSDLIDLTAADRADATKRFLREARAAAQIRHENMVAVLDVDEEGGRQYMVMELVDGVSCSAYLEGGPIDPREAARIGLEIARVLVAAHSAGVIHRDVKPENILLARDGRVKLSDFGIASIASHEGEDSARLTRTGIVVGTPHYISPEQVNGALIDARSDLYSLGATLFHLLTDTLPFSGSSGYQVCVKHVTEPADAPSTRVATIPAALDRIVLRLMEKEPGDRPQTAAEVVESLERFLMETDPPASAPRRDPEPATAPRRDPEPASEPPSAGVVRPPSKEPPAPGWAAPGATAVLPRPTELAAPASQPPPAPVPASAPVPTSVAVPVRAQREPRRFPWLALLVVLAVVPLAALAIRETGLHERFLPHLGGAGAGAGTGASASHPPVQIDPDATPQEVLFQGMKLAESDAESARYVLRRVTSTPGADATTRALAYYHLVGVSDRLGRKAEGDDAAASFLSLQDGLPRALVDAASAERLRARLR